MKRRDFIKTTGLAAAGVIINPSLALPANINKSLKVIIIGSGIAGLSAAYKLKKNNIDITILEARNRIGGRIFTHTIDEQNNLTVELGGEWVGESHIRMKEICAELELNLTNHQFETHMILNDKYHKPHQWGFQSEWDTKYQNLLDNFNNLSDTDKMAFDKLDWWRYLVNNGISETDLEIRELLDSTDFGETIRNVSAFAGISEYAESSPKNEMDYHIEGGNGKIIEKLSEKIGLENIKLKHKVISVDQYKDIIKIQCENGSNWTADKVICTIPTYSVNKIIWKPVLPSDMIEALNELQYSRIIKTSVLFKERFWKDESFDMITDSTPHYFFHSTKNQKGLKGVLTSYATGDKAFMISKLNEKEKITEICNALKPAFGNVEEYVDKLVSYYWGSDQYSQGAYAIYDSKQWLPVRETLNQGHLNVFFAGEHLADWQGFMEGSVNTGEAAAYKILE